MQLALDCIVELILGLVLWTTFVFTPWLVLPWTKQLRLLAPWLRKQALPCKLSTRSTIREIGEVINRHATMSGFSVVKSYCGHGIGELFHCAPNIPHYGRNKAVGIMKAGQTFTIEPMINAG
ncbi:hypothetical protein HN51_007332 [Arachis hypogaea]|uniref:methionine aminopeptidase 1A isoform X1 n=1 Tax=Arachis hypogaea TaxID=3818 RepID=UPI000A2C298E|nr:methionine aminopeptidase 1A [Arachis hypogaea]QHO41422.1 Methionine aminopeptidase 1A [Arachis hypogaea]